MKTKPLKTGPPGAAAAPGVWTVSIPLFLPCTLNRLMRLHWAKRHRQLCYEADMVYMYGVLLTGVPAATGKRRVTLRLVLAPKDQVRDSDSSEKGIRDHLTKAKLLVDDSPEWLEMAPLEQVRGKSRATVIRLEDC